jgi:UDP-N-acetylglucosamine acyltransferase
MAEIHPTAIVDPAARLAADVRIGPYCIIGPGVSVGAGCAAGPHAVIGGETEIGEGNRIGPFATLGMDPQDLKFKGENTRLRIGSRNVFREYCNVSKGSVDGNFETAIGDGNLFMAYVHIAHDCIVGNGAIFANAATLAGHVEIGDFAVIGGLAAIHQFTRIGAHVMIGGGSMVVQDIAPFVLAEGNRAVPLGINSRGLLRRGFTNEKIAGIKSAYRMVYRRKLPLAEALGRIEAELLPGCPELRIFIDFLRGTRRGVAR